MANSSPILLTVILVLLMFQATKSISLLSLIKAVDLEKPIGTFYAYGEHKGALSCVQEENLNELDIPKVIFSGDAGLQWSLNETKFNRQTLMIICMNNMENLNQTIDNVVQFKRRQRRHNLLFYWSLPYVEEVHEQPLEQFFMYCMAKFVTNVMAVFQDFPKTGQIFVYEQFPVFRMYTKRETEPYFRAHLGDMHGSPIRTIAFDGVPRAFSVTDSSGNERIIGYVKKLVTDYAAKHNASLVYTSVPMTKNIYEVVRMVTNGSVDIPMALLSDYNFRDHYVLSSYAEYTSLRVVLPKSGQTPLRELFPHIFIQMHGVIWLLIVFFAGLAIAAIRGVRKIEEVIYIYLLVFGVLLGQAVKFEHQRHVPYNQKLVRFLLFMSAILFNVLFVVILNMHILMPPQEPNIRSFGELMTTNIRIFTSSLRKIYTRDTLVLDVSEQYPSLFALKNDSNHMDTIRFAYVITDLHWNLIKGMLKRLYASEDLYFYRRYASAFPLHEFSLHVESLNNFLMQYWSSGLYNNLFNEAYKQLLKNTISDTEKIGPPESVEHQLTTNDLYCLWWLYIMGVITATGAWIGELLWSSFTKRK